MATPTRFIILLISSFFFLTNIHGKGGSNPMKVDKDIYEAYDRATDYLTNKKMLVVADSLERIGKKRNDNRIIILANKLRASYYYNVEDSTHAIAIYKKLYKLIEETPGAEEEYYDIASNDIRMLYEHTPSGAILRAKDMLKRATREKSAYGMFQAYATMGSLFYWRGDSKLAITNSLKAIDLANKANESKNIAYIYCDMALCYVELRNYSEALKQIRKARELDNDYIFYRFTECWILFKAGLTKEFTNAYNTLHNSADYNNLSEWDRGTLECYALASQGKQKEALSLIDNDKIDFYNDTRRDVLLSMGDYKGAFAEQIKIKAEADSIREQMQIEEMSYMDAQTNNGQLRIEAEEMKARQTMIVATCIVIIVLIALAFAIVIALRNKKHLKEMERKNIELEHANNVKSVFLKNLTHEMNTPLNFISGFAQILTNRDIELDEASTREMADGIQAGAEQLNTLFENIIEVTDKLSTLEELESTQTILQTINSSEQSNHAKM